ncbi:MAG: sigma-70 family polymerase sigma factor [Acidimicrobiales bacterium]|nr:sigma-70 family polymerase sigma factor [Acidimicrobiales bacterium]
MDDAGFEAWYRREHPRLLASMVVVTGDLGAAMEATDESFARAFERWDRVGAMASPGGWTYRTALHVVRRRERRRRLELRLLGRIARADVAAPPEWSVEVFEALRALPPRQRTAVALRFVAGLPSTEVAVAMGVTEGTVASTLSDARARLALALADPPDIPLELSDG